MTAYAQPASATDRSRRLATPGRIVLLVLIVSYLGLAVYSQSVLPLRLTKGTSMEPSLRQGDIILVKKVPFSDIHIGDVIAFKTPDAFVGSAPGTILHRVIDIGIRDERLALTTKGDNSGVDPVPVRPTDVRGRAVLRVKYIGIPIALITSRQGILFVSIATLLSLLYIPAFIMFYATVLRGGDESQVTALAIRPDPPASPDSRSAGVEYSDLRDTLMNLSERVDRIHSAVSVRPDSGRSIAGPIYGRSTQRAARSDANVGVLNQGPLDRSQQESWTFQRDGEVPAPHAGVDIEFGFPDGGGHAARDGRTKRQSTPKPRRFRSGQAVVSLHDGGSNRLDSEADGAFDSPHESYRLRRGTNGESKTTTLDRPEVRLFEQYRHALNSSENAGAAGAAGINAGDLQALVLEVVEVETPVHISDMRLEICQHLGFNPQSEIFKNQMESAIETLVSRRKIRRELANGSLSARGQFLTISGFDGYRKPRRRSGESESREISRISDLELREGVLAVLWAMYTAPPGPLMMETARQFGILRIDSKASGRINSVINQLIADGKISVGDGGVLH